MSSRIPINGSSAKIAAFAVFLWVCACLLPAGECHAQGLPEKSIREMIIKLNDNYIVLNKQLKELEDSVRDFPGTSISISVVKDDKSAELISVEVWDKDKPLKSHVYTPLDNEVLGMGGRHELYHGEVRRGTHGVKIVFYWKEGKKSAQKEEQIIPVTVAAGTTYFMELSFEKRKDRLELRSTQLDFSKGD